MMFAQMAKQQIRYPKIFIGNGTEEKQRNNQRRNGFAAFNVHQRP